MLKNHLRVPEDGGIRYNSLIFFVIMKFLIHSNKHLVKYIIWVYWDTPYVIS